ncbi:sulfatase [Paenibacillus sp. strain BS8-2]
MKNVIVLLVDTLRYDFMGFNGNEWVQTPNMNRLAEKSVVFDQAYLGSYPCMPARRDMLTGKLEFPFRGWGPMEANDRDLAKVITEENGIPSMLITDHFHLWEKGSGNYHFNFSAYEFIRGQEYDKWKIDTDSVQMPVGPEKSAGHCGDPEAYYARNRKNGAFRKTERDYFPAILMSEAGAWLEKNYTRDRFFLMIDCFDPHEPFDPPQHYIDLYDKDYRGQDVIWPTYGRNSLSEEETERVRKLYAAEITMTDRWIGYLLDQIELLGLMENTMIVLATDHGHMFGEHELMGKPWSGISDSNMYQEVAHIPLVVYHPQNPEPGKRVNDLVQLVDLYPTILDAFEISSPQDLQGRSLLPLLTGDHSGVAVQETVCFGRFGEALNITDGEWTLFIWPEDATNEPLYWYSSLPPQYGAAFATGDYENGRYPVACARGEQYSALYNVKSDYRQQHNVIADFPDVVSRLKRSAAAFLSNCGAPAEQFHRLGLDAYREGVRL